MKNVFSTQAIEGIKAVTLKAATLLASPIEMTNSHELNVEMLDGGLKSTSRDIVDNVLQMGVHYVIDSKDARLSNAVSEVLGNMLEKEIQIVVEDMFIEAQRGNVTQALADLNYAPEVLREIVGRLEAQGIEVMSQFATKQYTLEELVEMFNVEEVVIEKGSKLTEGQVVRMMEKDGLFIGGRCVAKMGEGTILGFIATSAGALMAQINIDGENEVRKVMADKIEAIGGAVQKEENLEAMMVSNSNIPWEETNKAAVEEVFAGNMGIRELESELTEAERLDQQEEARMANREAWLAEQEANKKANAQSEAAARILAIANQQLGIVAPSTTKAPAAAPKAPAQAPVDQPAQGVAGSKQAPKAPATTTRRASQPAGDTQPSAPAQQAGRSNRRSERKNAGGTGGSTRVNTGAARSAAGTTAPRTRLSAGAPVNGGNGNRAAANTGSVRLSVDAPVQGVNTPFARWYENPRFELVISGEELAETRQNLQLGITDVKIYDAHDYAASRGYEARDNDMAVIEVHFGPSLSFQFNFKFSSNPEAKQPFYSSNISRVKSKRGTEFWTYVVGRREDTAFLIEKKGEWVRATSKEVEKASKDQLWEVKGTEWVNDSIYGMRMGEDVIAQVMRFADFAYNELYVTQV